MSILHSLAGAILQIVPAKAKSVPFKKGEIGMKRRLRCLVGLIIVFLCAAITVGSRQLRGQTVVATIDVEVRPQDVCVNLNTNRVYVANLANDNVSVIDGATNRVIATIKVKDRPRGVGINPNTNCVYVANEGSGNVSVIDERRKHVTTIDVGFRPQDVCVNPNTNRVYVANAGSDNVSVIDEAKKHVTTIKVGGNPFGVCVNPNTNRVYVTYTNGYGVNRESGNVSVIDGAATNPVIKRRDEFVKKNGVEEWPDISELAANPFVYEGKIIAIQAGFKTMQTATQGVFVVGNGAFFVVSDIPKGMFKNTGSIVLAGRVLGKTDLQIPLFGLMQVPHLKFVGVHFCKDYTCKDIIPE